MQNQREQRQDEPIKMKRKRKKLSAWLIQRLAPFAVSMSSAQVGCRTDLEGRTSSTRHNKRSSEYTAHVCESCCSASNLPTHDTSTTHRGCFASSSNGFYPKNKIVVVHIDSRMWCVTSLQHLFANEYQSRFRLTANIMSLMCRMFSSELHTISDNARERVV